MAYRPLQRAKANDTSSKNNEDIVIQDEGTVPLRTKTIPNNNPHIFSQYSGRSDLQDGKRGLNSAVSHGLLMQYQAPVLIVKRPKYIRSGPFDIYDAPDLRVLKDNFRKDYQRQVQNKQVNLKFYEDLELEDYFSKKSNWLNTAKYMNTASFFSAVNVYLPLVKNKSVDELAKKYTSERNSRVGSSMTNPTVYSTSQSRMSTSQRMQ